ncbi:hypothetical protein JXL19_08840 [bacterium]|nr:hypothetical protein [bacterium]
MLEHWHSSAIGVARSATPIKVYQKKGNPDGMKSEQDNIYLRKRYILFIFTILVILICTLSCNHISSVHEEALPSQAQRFLFPSQPVKRLCPVEVIFDQSKDQVFSPWDTGFMGFSEAALLLQRSGLWVSCNNRSLEEFFKDATAASILVLGVANGHSASYTQEEISAAERFVKQGGSLLIIGEHENMYGSGDFQNPMMERFGFRFEPVGVIEKGEVSPSSSEADIFWPWFSCPELDIADIRFFLAGNIHVSKPEEALAMTDESTEPENAVLAAWKQVGKGRVIACADSEFLWNGNQDMGIRVGGNLEFTRQIFLWLAQKDVAKRHVLESPFVQKCPSRGRVLFDICDNGRGLEYSKSGLYQLARSFEENGYEVFYAYQPLPSYRRFSLVVVPWSLSQDPVALKRHGRYLNRSAKKVLLLGEACSSFQAILDHDANLAENTPFADFQDPPIPMNHIAEEFNITFLPYILMSEGGSYFRAKAIWGKERIMLNRACVVSALNGIKMKSLAKGEEGTWGESLLFVADQPGGNDVARNAFSFDSEEGDMPMPVIALSDNRIMAIGGLDLLTNDRFFEPESQFVFQQILLWI